MLHVLMCVFVLVNLAIFQQQNNGDDQYNNRNGMIAPKRFREKYTGQCGGEEWRTGKDNLSPCGAQLLRGCDVQRDAGAVREGANRKCETNHRCTRPRCP